MTRIRPRRRLRASSILELLIVLLTLALIFLGLILPTLSGSGKATRITCISHLKQVGLALRMWSGDHGGKFPMAVSTNQGGSLEFTGPSDVWRHFQVISNELNSPKVLSCPSDKKRKEHRDFASLNNQHLSYFIGLDASEYLSNMLLTGDRNLTTNGRVMSGILTLTSDSPLAWTKDIHAKGLGANIGLADGSARQVDIRGLCELITLGTNVGARPDLP